MGESGTQRLHLQYRAVLVTPFSHFPQQEVAQRYLAVTVSDWAVIATAVGTLLLAVIAALQDKIRSWIMRPNLRMSVRVAPPECHKTSAHFQTTSTDRLLAGAQI